MRYTFILFCLLVFSDSAKGQWGVLFSENEFEHPGLNRSFHILSSVVSGSDRFSGRFVTDYWNGGFLSADSRRDQFNRLKTISDLGLQWSSSLVYQNRGFRFGRLTGMRISYNHFILHEASVSKGLFGLYFFGNSGNDSLSVALGPSNEKRQSFQSFKLGSGFKSGRWEFRANIGLLLGIDFVDRSIQEGSLSTSSSATEIFVDLKYKGVNSDLGKNRIFSPSGYGIIGDLGLSFNYSNSGFVSMEFNRLGFVSWNSGLKRTLIDTSYLFDGVEVRGFLDSLYLDIQSSEDLENRFAKIESSSTLNQMLPWDITLRWHHTWAGSKFAANGLFRWMPDSSFGTGAEGALIWNAFKWLSTSIHAGAGNYSRFNLGLGLGLKMGQGLYLAFRITSLSNWAYTAGDAGWNGHFHLYKAL